MVQPLLQTFEVEQRTYKSKELIREGKLAAIVYDTFMHPKFNFVVEKESEQILRFCKSVAETKNYLK